MTSEREILQLFADLCRYPKTEVSEMAAQGVVLLQQLEYPAAAASLEGFRQYVRREPPLRLEEVYTAAFDLRPCCAPYVGWQLCGETPQRTVFLLRLRETYRDCGLEPGSELPDHLGEVLDFLARADDSEVRQELATEALQPALEKMLSAFGDERGHPYRMLLAALQTFLVAAFAENGLLTDNSDLSSESLLP